MINEVYKSKLEALVELKMCLEELNGRVSLAIKGENIEGRIGSTDVSISLNLIPSGEESGMLEFLSVTLPDNAKEEEINPIVRLISDVVGIEPDLSYIKTTEIDKRPKTFEWCRDPKVRVKNIPWGIEATKSEIFFTPKGIYFEGCPYSRDTNITGTLTVSYDGYCEGTIKDQYFGECFVFGINDANGKTYLFAQGNDGPESKSPVFFTIRSEKGDASFDCILQSQDPAETKKYRNLIIQPGIFFEDENLPNEYKDVLAHSRIMAALQKDSLSPETETIYNAMQRARENGEVLSADTLMATLKKYYSTANSTGNDKAPYQKVISQQ